MNRSYTSMHLTNSPRRWLAGFSLFGLVVLALLWRSAVTRRTAPNEWNHSEYAEADKVLKGWRKGICTNTGFCGNWWTRGKLGSHQGGGGGGNWVKENMGAPSYVLDYAPYVYLHSREKFMPGDIGEHLIHTTPQLNYTPITSSSNHPLLSNLDDLNKFGDHVYLTSDDDPSNPPAWLRGDRNVPSSASNSKSKDEVGLSSAPAVIIWTEKDDGIVDAFYFYFYSFNQGNTVAGWRFGNHVGDWEHNAVRFVDGEPISMFYSEHSGGAAYEYAVVEKIGKRPVTYSARGSHANYATPGTHYYAIPFHLLADHTDKGYLWDPAKNNLLYHYNTTSEILTPDAANADAPMAWFHYEGRWGDRYYPLDDRRQYRVVGQYHYVNGPTGPKDKNMGRHAICQNERICVVQPSLTYRLEGIEPGEDEDEWTRRALGIGEEGKVVVEFRDMEV